MALRQEQREVHMFKETKESFVLDLERMSGKTKGNVQLHLEGLAAHSKGFRFYYKFNKKTLGIFIQLMYRLYTTKWHDSYPIFTRNKKSQNNELHIQYNILRDICQWFKLPSFVLSSWLSVSVNFRFLSRKQWWKVWKKRFFGEEEKLELNYWQWNKGFDLDFFPNFFFSFPMGKMEACELICRKVKFDLFSL